MFSPFSSEALTAITRTGTNKADLRRAEAKTQRWREVLDGLAHVPAGGRFSATGLARQGSGRRFLGWTVGRHWHFG